MPGERKSIFGKNFILPKSTFSLSDQQKQYEQSEADTFADCAQCFRPGAPLFCFSCGFWMAKGRVAQPCPTHPKVVFYTDFKACPKCKQPGTLRELD